MAILNNQRIKNKNTYDVSLSMTPVDYMMITPVVETKKESKVLLMGFSGVISHQDCHFNMGH